MLRRIIAALFAVALLASPSMITSANTTETVINPVLAEGETVSEVETTVVSTEDSEETTTTTAVTMSPEEIGAAIRENIDIEVRDVIAFDDVVQLTDQNGATLYADINWHIWVIGIDDSNQRFRVQAPKVTPNGEFITYLSYADVADAVVIGKGEGHVIGDLDFNGVINAKDLTCMKQKFLYGWDMDKERAIYNLSDWSADGKVAINDVVLMKRFLLGD